MNIIEALLSIEVAKIQTLKSRTVDHNDLFKQLLTVSVKQKTGAVLKAVRPHINISSQSVATQSKTSLTSVGDKYQDECFMYLQLDFLITLMISYTDGPWVTSDMYILQKCDALQRS